MLYYVCLDCVLRYRTDPTPFAFRHGRGKSNSTEKSKLEDVRMTRKYHSVHAISFLNRICVWHGTLTRVHIP